MAFTLTSIGAANGKSATQLSITTPIVPAGSLIVVAVCDGNQTWAGPNPPTDTGFNAYFAAGVTNGGVQTSGATGICHSYNVAALASGGAVRYTPVSAFGAAVSAFYVTGAETTSNPLHGASYATAAGTSTTPSVTLAATPPANGLQIALVGINGPSGDTFTQATSVAWATPPVRNGTTGGVANTNFTIAGGSVVSSAQNTYAPTLGTSRDWGAVIAAFSPAVINANVNIPKVTAYGTGGSHYVGMALPAYWYPDSFWTQITAASPRVGGYVIFNPATGPGVSLDTTYLAYVTAIKNAGVKAIGYVPTTNAARAASTVKADIDKYKLWYGVSGIFLDEVSGLTANLAYYQDLADYIRLTAGTFVVLNPGSIPADEGYMSIGDSVAIFETDYTGYLAWTPPSWNYNYPASKISHLIYDVPTTTDMAIVMNLAKIRNAGHVYITDDYFRNPGTDNPWDSLASYWTAELALLGDPGDFVPTTTKAITGVSATKQVGTVQASILRTVPVTGVSATAVADGSTNLKMAFPAYWYPDSDWNQIVASSPAVNGYVIINPNNGPGSPIDSTYTSYVSMLQSAGVKVLGYVPASTARTALAIQADVTTYIAWYNVNGIVLGQVTGLVGDNSFYSGIAAFIRGTSGPFVVLSPGAIPDVGYIAIGDSTIIFLSNYTAYLTWTPPSWYADYPATKITHLIFSTPDQAAMTNAISLAKARNAGYVGISDSASFGALPSFWTAERALLGGSFATANANKTLTGVSATKQVGTLKANPGRALIGVSATAIADGSTNLKMAFPAYWYPDSNWNQIVASSPAVGGYVIINPNNGPGSPIDPTYTSYVSMLQSAGVRVLGYVPAPTTRLASAVQADVTTYNSWYNVNGIFLGEVTGLIGDISFYSGIAAFIRGTSGTFVVLCPAAIPDVGYIAIGDSTVIFFNDYATYLTWTPPSWNNDYALTKITHLIFSAPDQAAMTNAISLAKARNTGYVFITDSSSFTSLPTYWTAERALLGGSAVTTINGVVKGITGVSGTKQVGTLKATVTKSFSGVSATAVVDGSTNLKMAFPAYWYPDANWNQIIASSPAVGGYVIINPGNGPGLSLDTTYQSYAATLRAAGLKVLGYVPANTSRTAAEVKADIDSFKSWYSVSGIFLSEVTGIAGDNAFYLDLTNYVRATSGTFVVLDSGGIPDVGYVALADSIVLFLNTYANYLSFSPPSWNNNYALTKISHIIYSAPDQAAMTNAISLAKARNAGYVGISDSASFGALPSYWTAELALLDGSAVTANPTRAITGVAATKGVGTVKTSLVEPLSSVRATALTGPDFAGIPISGVAATGIADTNNGGMALPAYFYPTPGNLWDQVIAGSPRVGGYVILNPATGPGTGSDSNYVTAVTNAKNAGLKVLGYITTLSATRTAANVKADVDSYKSWYGVSGIYLDAVTGLTGDINYYQDLADYIRSTTGTYVVLNPGSIPADESYMSIGDSVVIFLSDYASYLTWTPPSWAGSYPSSKISHIVFSASGTAALTNAMSLAKARNAGHVYVTDLAFTTLPSYWTTELAIYAADIITPNIRESVTGVSGTGQRNVPTLLISGGTVFAHVSSGVSGTTQLGNLTPQHDNLKLLDGVAGAKQVGALTVQVSDALPAVSGAAQRGTLTPNVSEPLTGVSGTGQRNPPTASVTDTASPSTVAATGQLGTVSIVSGSLANVSGVSGTASLGTPTIRHDETASPIDVSATGQIGSLTLQYNGSKLLVGVAGTKQVGPVSIVSGSIANPPAVSATLQLGTLAPHYDKLTNLVAVSAAAQLGTVAPIRGIILTGQAATGQVGSLAVRIHDAVTLAGVFATGQRGTVSKQIGAGTAALGPKTRYHYAPTANIVSGVYVPAAAGFNLADVSSVAELAALPSGVLGLLYIGNPSGVDTTFINLIATLSGNPTALAKLWGFYLAKDASPDPATTWGTFYDASNLAAQVIYINSHLPGYSTFISLTNFGSDDYHVTYATYNGFTGYTPASTGIDYYGIAAYPVATDLTGGYDLTVIDNHVAAATTVGITSNKIIPIYQTFGGGTWVRPYVVPTTGQVSAYLAYWVAFAPTPAFDYAFSWGTQQSDSSLVTLPVLRAAISQHNSQTMGVAAAAVIGEVTARVLVAPPVSATGRVGTIRVKVQPTLSGIAAPAQLGSVTVSADNTVSPWLVPAAGLVGSIKTKIIEPLVANPGVAALGNIGTLVDDSLTITLSGVSASGTRGSLAKAQTLLLTGNAGSLNLGTVIARPARIPSGVAATGHVGSTTKTVSKPLTAVSAAGNCGVPVATRSAQISGVAATGQRGTPSISKGTSCHVTGVVGAASIGSLSTSVSRDKQISGVTSQGEIDTTVAETDIALIGHSIASAAGEISAQFESILDGVSSAASPGTLVSSFDGMAPLEGLAGNAERGDVDFFAGMPLVIDGAIGEAGSLMFPQRVFVIIIG